MTDMQADDMDDVDLVLALLRSDDPLVRAAGRRLETLAEEVEGHDAALAEAFEDGVESRREEVEARDTRIADLEAEIQDLTEMLEVMS